MTEPQDLRQVHEFCLSLEVDTGDLIRRGIVQERIEKALQDPRTKEVFQDILPGTVKVEVLPKQ